MSTPEWNPDPKVIALLEQVANTNIDGRLVVGGKVRTWADVLNEVKEGTEFGRIYHDEVLELLLAKRFRTKR